MSAAAARRRKQKLAKAAAADANATAGDDDPVTLRLNALLAEESAPESTAYEALQLAQSQVRRFVRLGRYSDATDMSYDVSLTLLTKHGRVSVASQLIALLVQVLNETHTECTDAWVRRVADLDAAYRTALASSPASADMDPDERDRLGRLHLQFLRGVVKWSEVLGTVRYGHPDLHDLLGRQCWRLADSTSARGEADGATTDEEAAEADEAADGGDAGAVGDDEEDEDASVPWLRCEAVTHLSLAEKPDVIADYLRTLPAPTSEQVRSGHKCPPSERDSLLTRSVLVLVAVENLRDANFLLRTYLDTIEEREAETLRKSYMDKKDGVAPSHSIFCSMLLRVVEKETKTGPLYSWLLRSFGSELGRMYKPDVVKAYTTKIGRIYFNIQPPPSMMSTLESMMGMMGGPMGAGGGGGGPMGGMNPAMMQAMAAQMQGMQGM